MLVRVEGCDAEEGKHADDDEDVKFMGTELSNCWNAFPLSLDLIHAAIILFASASTAMLLFRFVRLEVGRPRLFRFGFSRGGGFVPTKRCPMRERRNRNIRSTKLREKASDCSVAFMKQVLPRFSSPTIPG